MVNYAIRFWGFILTFFLFRFIVGHIGEVEYGIYLFITAITGYFGLLDLGIGASLVKFVAQFQAEKDEEKLNRIINTTFFIFMFIGIIGGIILLLIGTFLLDFLIPDSPEIIPIAKGVIYILGASFFFGLSLASLKGILAGLQRYDILAVVAFIMSIVNLVVVILVLSWGYGIVELVFYTTTSGLLGFIIMAFYIRKLLPGFSIRFSFMKRKMIKTLMDMSMSVFLLSILIMIIYYTDRLVIGIFLDIALITFYQAAWKLYGIPTKIPEIGLQAIIPAASELEAKDNLPALRRLFLRGTKYVLAMCFALAIPMIFLAKQVLSVWMDPTYEQYYIVVQILIISLFFSFNNYVANQILIGMNKIKHYVKYYVVIAVFNLVLSITLVKLGFGLNGVALGTTIPFIVVEYFFLNHVFKLLGIKWGTYLKKVVLKTFPYAVVIAALMYGLLLLYVPPSEAFFWDAVPVGIYYLFGLILYFILFYYFGLEQYEKKEIKQVISRIKARLKPAKEKTA
jgi:O-antigen/teichoic acid export membrane protein